jgi:hypothetical protein
MGNKVKFYGISEYKFKDILDDIKLNNYDIIFHMSQTEASSYFNYFTPDEKFYEFKNFLKEKNIKFYLIVGSEFQESIHTHPESFYTVLSWPTFLLHFAYHNIVTQFPNFNNQISKIEYDYLYLCYNNRKHHHRCLLMDLLSKNNLMENGLISWRKKSFPKDVKYNFKYWNEEILEIDQIDNNFNEYTNKMLNPKCFVNVVTESNYRHMFITEKTYKAVILEQPFLCFAHANQNYTLEKYGFKLYDEIFDYSFDKLISLEDRALGIVNNLLSLNGKDLNVLYEKIKEKIKYNKQRAMDIIKNDTYVPIELLMFYNENKDEYLKSCKDGIFPEYVYKYIKNNSL